MDWPEAIWDMWMSFENHHGTIEQVNTALMQISSLAEDLARNRLEVSYEDGFKQYRYPDLHGRSDGVRNGRQDSPYRSPRNSLRPLWTSQNIHPRIRRTC
jgi:hypothetical protein